MKNKKKNSKGITLIALIITIIVMLILVGVTINVAINGELFETAKKGATGTTIEAEKEQLLGAVLGAYDAETGVDFERLNENLPEGWEAISTDGVYKSPKEKIYTVNKRTMEITEGEGSSDEDDLEILRELLIGKDADYIDEIFDGTSNEVNGKTIVTNYEDKRFNDRVIISYNGNYYAIIFSTIGTGKDIYFDKVIAVDLDNEYAPNTDKNNYFILDTNEFNDGAWITGLTAQGVLQLEKDKKITVPATVTDKDNNVYNVVAIGSIATYNKSLETIEFENGINIRSIGKYTGCSNLTGIINIPESVTGIERNAFEDTGITGVTFNGTNLKYIEESSFKDCSNLTGVVEIPSSVTYIYGPAFEGTNISEIIINNSEGAISGAPWGATNAQITYNY